MSFCSFSKDFNERTHTEVENRFIAKYLPEADGFAVKVYLYGLYLCSISSDFSLTSMAEVLSSTEEEIKNAFLFWQDYDLVEVFSSDPFAVHYLPVSSSAGKPKKVHYEKYADFNKELQRRMQAVGKFVSYNEAVKYMNFLEENEMQPQALLLIAEYCIGKQGESVSPSYIFNKAKAYMRAGLFTYEQVERELSSYNENEGAVSSILSALALYKKPDEEEYAYYKKWTKEYAFSKDAVLCVAKHQKHGGFLALDLLLSDLYKKGKLTKDEVEEELALTDLLSSTVYQVARKLGQKIGSATPFVEEYAKKWYNYGFGEDALLSLASYALKIGRSDFQGLNGLLETLFDQGIVSDDSVKDFLLKKNEEIKLLSKLQPYLGAVKQSEQNLILIDTWHKWNFSDEMILEAAKRSATASSPVPYMNKILSDWKRTNVFSVAQIPNKTTTAVGYATNEKTERLNEKSAREKYYADLHARALSRVEKVEEKANGNEKYRGVRLELKKMEIAIAKAELTAPETVNGLKEEKKRLISERNALLEEMGITEEMLTPHFSCEKCSDTGYLPDGRACDCYVKG